MLMRGTTIAQVTLKLPAYLFDLLDRHPYEPSMCVIEQIGLGRICLQIGDERLNLWNTKFQRGRGVGIKVKIHPAV